MIKGKQPYRKFNTNRANILFGNIVLPSDVKRDDYIKYCHRTGTVSVIEDDGTFTREVPVVHSFCGVNDGFIYDLNIPEDVGVLGDRVVMIPFMQDTTPFIVGTLKRADSDIRVSGEKQVRITKVNRKEDGVESAFEIMGDGLNGIINLNLLNINVLAFNLFENIFTSMYKD